MIVLKFKQIVLCDQLWNTYLVFSVQAICCGFLTTKKSSSKYVRFGTDLKLYTHILSFGINLYCRAQSYIHTYFALASIYIVGL